MWFQLDRGRHVHWWSQKSISKNTRLSEQSPCAKKVDASRERSWSESSFCKIAAKMCMLTKHHCHTAGVFPVCEEKDSYMCNVRPHLSDRGVYAHSLCPIAPSAADNPDNCTIILVVAEEVMVSHRMSDLPNETQPWTWTTLLNPTKVPMCAPYQSFRQASGQPTQGEVDQHVTTGHAFRRSNACCLIACKRHCGHPRPDQQRPSRCRSCHSSGQHLHARQCWPFGRTIRNR